MSRRAGIGFLARPEQGFNPNLIVFLPEWYNAAGHCNNGPASCF